MMRECGCRANAQEELAASPRLRFTPEQLKLLKDKEEESKIAVGAVCLLVIVISFPASIWSAFVTLKLWRWFAEPIGLPHMTMIPLMGLWLLISMFRYSPLKSSDFDTKVKKDPGKFFKDYCYNVALYPAFALLIGYVYTLFQ